MSPIPKTSFLFGTFIRRFLQQTGSSPLVFWCYKGIYVISVSTVKTKIFVELKACLYHHNVDLKDTKGISLKKPEIVRSW